jgi:TonB-linked SusC/RagA family outer membrane protein
MKSFYTAKRACLLTMLVWLLALSATYAQSTVTGTVTDENNQPMPGVSIKVKGSKSGGTTNTNGKFSLAVPANATLVFSFIGYQPKEIAIGTQAQVDLKLEPNQANLNEVVVTALGIKKEKKRLGYAVQEVKGDALQKAISPNVVESLTGKVAGLTVTNSSDFFSDPKLYLRGKKPLIVIDGVPSTTTDMWNISSDDIENISVLKGAAASALYGSLGLNGAVQISLKSSANAAKGTTMSFNSSTTFQGGFIRIPKAQTQYGPGDAGEYAFGTGGPGGGGINDFDYSIWGPKFDGRLLPQYDSPIDASTGKRIPTPWLSRGEDNLGNFMETGLVTSNNFSVQSRGESGGVTLSDTYKYSKASVPGAKLNINTFRLNGNLNLSDKLSVDGSLQHTYEYASNMPRNNYGPHSPIYNLSIWGGAHFDIRDFKDYWVPGKEGIKQRFVENWRYNNPYMLANEWKRPYTKNDVLGFLKLNYKISDKFDAHVRTSLNTYSLTKDEEISMDIYDYDISDRGGRYRHNEFGMLESNTDFLLKYHDNFFNDNFNINATLGGNQLYKSNREAHAATTKLIVPGIFKLDNSTDKVLPTSYKDEKGIYSAYSSIDLAYKNQIFLGMTGRVDKSSTLPEKNSTFFYPSLSLSAVVSDMLHLPKAISFLKLRAAYAKVGSDKIGDDGDDYDVYNAVNSYTTGSRNRNLPIAAYPGIIDNPNLKPEFNTTYEYGVEARFLNDRLGFDFSYYSNNYGPQIFTQIFSQTSGYTGIRLNGRTTQRRGFDFSFNATPIKTDNFSWLALINVDGGKDYLKSLPPLADGSPQLKEGRTPVGGRLDDYWYSDWEKSPDGKLIMNADGLPRITDYDVNIGNQKTSFSVSMNNTFSYKNISLSFLVDGRFGGITYDRFERDLWRSGSHPDAIAPERELSNIAYANGTDPRTMLIPGVKIVSGEAKYDPDGKMLSDTRVFAPNDYKVDYQTWAKQYMAAWQNNVIDKTFIKLREVVLTYNVPAAFLKNKFLKGASLSFVGRNLYYWTKDKTFGDLDTYSMSTGDTDLQQPAQRTYGFNINLKF